MAEKIYSVLIGLKNFPGRRGKIKPSIATEELRVLTCTIQNVSVACRMSR